MPEAGHGIVRIGPMTVPLQSFRGSRQLSMRNEKIEIGEIRVARFG